MKNATTTGKSHPKQLFQDTARCVIAVKSIELREIEDIQGKPGKKLDGLIREQYGGKSNRG